MGRILPAWVNTAVEIVKSSSLVSLVSVVDLTMAIQQIVGRTREALLFYAVAAALYFTINFTPAGLVNGGPGAGQNGGQAQGATPAASDPSGGLSLPDAISKQMGLKLELRKRQLPVLVIDHLEEKPTDN